jgi:hypothetical protein
MEFLLRKFLFLLLLALGRFCFDSMSADDENISHVPSLLPSSPSPHLANASSLSTLEPEGQLDKPLSKTQQKKLRVCMNFASSPSFWESYFSQKMEERRRRKEEVKLIVKKRKAEGLEGFFCNNSRQYFVIHLFLTLLLSFSGRKKAFEKRRSRERTQACSLRCCASYIHIDIRLQF